VVAGEGLGGQGTDTIIQFVNNSIPREVTAAFSLGRRGFSACALGLFWLRLCIIISIL